MMCYKLIVFYYIFAATGVRADEILVKYEDCINLYLSQDNFCCRSLEAIKEVIKDVRFAECLSEHGCEYYTCTMDKKGLIKKGKDSDEEINALVHKYIQNSNPGTKKMGDRIRAKCLKGQYKKYPAIGCRALQIPECIYMNGLMACDSWIDDKECKKQAAYAAQCKASIDQEEGNGK